MASQQEPLRLPQRVMNTFSEARAPSTGCLYALKSSFFQLVHSQKKNIPLSSDSASILSFLQELLGVGCTPYTLKVYVVVITVHQTP